MNAKKMKKPTRALKAQHPRKPPPKLIQDMIRKAEARTQTLHGDYRMVLNAVWCQALAAAHPAEALKHREVFENLHNEHWIAAMIRALGKHETSFYNKYGARLATDGFEGKGWLCIWQELRSLLNVDLGGMQGRLLYAAMVALAVNAGFREEDFQ